MKCIICGCTQNSACIHPGAGPCSWHAPSLCDMCADPQIFLEATRPGKNTLNLKPITTRNLKTAYLRLGMNIKVLTVKDTPYTKLIRLKKGVNKKSLYNLITEAWFPNAKLLAIGIYGIDLDETRPQLEARGIRLANQNQ